MDFLSENSLMPESLTRPKTAVYVISPDETHVFGSIVVATLNQLMSGLITIAQNEYQGVLPCRVDFILDEMGNLPARIPDMEALVSAARSRNIRFHFVLQSTDQLDHVYGEHLSNVILDNCDTWLYMGTKSLAFLQKLSELCGNVRMMSGLERPLMPISTLQSLETRQRETETLVRLASLKPYVTPLLDIGLYETPADAPEKAELEQALDVIEHGSSAKECYDAISLVLGGRLMLTNAQKDRISKVCGKGDASHLTYKQRQLLLSCIS